MSVLLRPIISLSGTPLGRTFNVPGALVSAKNIVGRPYGAKVFAKLRKFKKYFDTVLIFVDLWNPYYYGEMVGPLQAAPGHCRGAPGPLPGALGTCPARSFRPRVSSVGLMEDLCTALRKEHADAIVLADHQPCHAHAP